MFELQTGIDGDLAQQLRLLSHDFLYIHAAFDREHHCVAATLRIVDNCEKELPVNLDSLLDEDLDDHLPTNFGAEQRPGCCVSLVQRVGAEDPSRFPAPSGGHLCLHHDPSQVGGGVLSLFGGSREHAGRHPNPGLGYETLRGVLSDVHVSVHPGECLVGLAVRRVRGGDPSVMYSI